MFMQSDVDALPLAEERAGEPRWRQAVVQPEQDRREFREAGEREIGPDAYRPYRTLCEGGHTAPAPYDPKGLVVVASAWLVFYIIAAVHDLRASSY
jgi:hypothetical protein